MRFGVKAWNDCFGVWMLYALIILMVIHVVITKLKCEHKKIKLKRAKKKQFKNKKKAIMASIRAQ